MMQDSVQQRTREMLAVETETKLMAATVKAGAGSQPAFVVEAPQALFDARVPGWIAGRNTFVYSVAADGKRFLVNTGGDTAETPLTVVVNWLASVKK